MHSTSGVADQRGVKVKMSKSAKKTDTAKPTKKKRSYVKQADVPSMSVDEALRVARALSDQYGKEPTRPLDVAKALELAPTAGPFRMLTGASIAYGFTEGGYNADQIALTELGRRVVAPTEEGDDLRARRAGFLQPRVIKEFMTKYDGSPVPSATIGKNVLESMGVAADHTERTLQVILDGARTLGLLTEISGKQYVNIKRDAAAPDADDEPGVEKLEGDTEGADALPDFGQSSEQPLDPPPPAQPESAKRPNVLFVGHGKNKKPLNQLTGLLDKLKIPYLVAAAEPNKGRPIPIKVRETMEKCGAGILIFSADEELFDKDQNPVYKNSENVGHELGAAAVMYDDRIIIFKEESVSLASNYESIGYIEFERDKLDAKLADLLTELVALKILQVQVGE